MTGLSAGPKRVLIVDDSSTMRAMLHEIIADRLGFEVVGAAKGAEEALGLIAKTLPDIAIIDLCMPYIDGSRLLGMLHGYPAMAKVVLSSSANASEAVQKKLFELGASAFFDKQSIAADPEAFRAKLLLIGKKARPPVNRGSIEKTPAASSNVIFAASRFPIPRDEAARLAKLGILQMANLAVVPHLDIVVRHVARSIDYPIVAMNLMDADMLWVKAAVGIDRQAMPREHSFCAHAICQDGPLIVTDALCHSGFGKLPMVTGEPRIRAYIGVPIVSRDRINLGVLCAANSRPRRPSNAEVAVLIDAARLIADFLEEPGQAGRHVA